MVKYAENRWGGRIMRRPKIGLALGSGGARGYAHIGVLKVLEKHQIPIDFIAGTSMGSFVGVLYANGINIELLGKLVSHMKRKNLIDLVVPKRGLIRGTLIKEMVRLLTHGKRLEQLAIPTAVVATDLILGERVVFREGPADDAVRASISIPGIFEPVELEGKLLVDGAVLDRVPISVVREMGADIVIAVDVGPAELNKDVRTIFDVISQTLDIMERETSKYRGIQPDVLIRPEVGSHGITQFENVDWLINQGEESAQSMVSQIIQLVENWEDTNGAKG